MSISGDVDLKTTERSRVVSPPLLKDHQTDIPEEIFDEIKGIVKRESGLDIGNYKDKCIKRRIAVRIRARGCLSARDYLMRLKGDRDETGKLLRVLTINVTQFFRNMPTFDKIREVVFPEIFRNKASEGNLNLRVWSAGCSSGEEPYSLAILLREFFEEELRRFSTFIIATDFDEEMIARAREGAYDERNMQEMPARLREKYFTREDNVYRLADKVKRMVAFRRRNLLTDKIYRDQDMILCRNILIYFSREQQRQILAKLAEALNIGGFLALGKAETLMADSRKHFRTICPRERIYQKVG